jgi:hypothetical protein
MKARATRLALALLLLSFLMVARFSLLPAAGHASAASGPPLYFLSAPTLRRLSLGYDGLAADIYWTRAVQYFGSRHQHQATSYEQLAPLLETATSLDPQLLVAYEFGANFLAPSPPAGAGMPHEAVRLLEFGIRHNPAQWRLYYSLGFVHYTELKEYVQAERAFEDGSRVPQAHPFLRILAAQMAQHAGELQTARLLWTATWQTAQEEQVRENAMAHLRALKVEQDVVLLEDAAGKYREANGHFPAALPALVTARLLPGLSLDPDGMPYKITRDGHIEVAHPENFRYLERGLPSQERGTGSDGQRLKAR